MPPLISDYFLSLSDAELIFIFAAMLILDATPLMPMPPLLRY